jgi:hypothetical protein
MARSTGARAVKLPPLVTKTFDIFSRASLAVGYIFPSMGLTRHDVVASHDSVQGICHPAIATTSTETEVAGGKGAMRYGRKLGNR